MTVITHTDVDGVLCVAALIKMLQQKNSGKDPSEITGNLRIFFTTPTKIFNTLAKSIPELNKVEDEDFNIGQLFICDLSLNRDTLLGSSVFNTVKWFDHHEVDSNEQYDQELDNVEILIDSMSDSTTSIVCRYYNLNIELGNIADEIDSNNVTTELAQRVRDIIGALKLKYSGTRLKTLLFGFATELSEDINNINDDLYNPIIEEYQKWLEEFDNFTKENIKLHTINGHKIGILETENTAPVFSIFNNLKNHPEAPLDILTIMIHKYFRIGKDRNNKYKNKKFTKLEFRTYTDQNILELAKLFGGGGHKFASGATVMDGVEIEELLKSIETYYTAPPTTTNVEEKD